MKSINLIVVRCSATRADCALTKGGVELWQSRNQYGIWSWKWLSQWHQL